MRAGAWVAVGAGAVGIAALLTAVPMVPSERALGAAAATVQVTADASPWCAEVAIAAELSATAVQPLVDVFGLTRLEPVSVSDVEVVSDPACGETPAEASTQVRISMDPCDAPPLEYGTRRSSLCDATAVGLRLESANGLVAQQGAYDTWTLGSAWERDWDGCVTVETQVEFLGEDGEAAATASEDGTGLCVLGS